MCSIVNKILKYEANTQLYHSMMLKNVFCLFRSFFFLFVCAAALFSFCLNRMKTQKEWTKNNSNTERFTVKMFRVVYGLSLAFFIVSTFQKNKNRSWTVYVVRFKQHKTPAGVSLYQNSVRPSTDDAAFIHIVWK